MSAKAIKRENPWLNLGMNVVLPAIVLMKGKSLLEDYWSGGDDDLTLLVFLLALSFPILYGAYDLAVRRKWNLLSILGLVGVLLTGGIGVLKLPPEWIAIKEAAIPGIIGLAFLASQLIHRPLIELLLLRTEMFDVARIEASLREAGDKASFDRLLRRVNGLMAASFLLSASLNYVLASMIVVSPAGSDAFNEELGRMTLLSYPVIAVPTIIIMTIALWLLFHGIERLTGLRAEELVIRR